MTGVHDGSAGTIEATDLIERLEAMERGEGAPIPLAKVIGTLKRMRDAAQPTRMAGGDWAQLLTLRDVMKTAYKRGGDRLMSVWERDLNAIEAAIMILDKAARPPAAPVDQERLAELQNEAGMYKSLYENAIAQRSSAGNEPVAYQMRETGGEWLDPFPARDIDATRRRYAVPLGGGVVELRALYAGQPQTPSAPSAGSAEARAACDWPSGEFSFHDEPGEHDPCYVVMPGGAMLPLNHHTGEGVDIARAKFIVAACNAALIPAQPQTLSKPEAPGATDALIAVWDDWVIANDESGMENYEIKDVAPETVDLVERVLRGRQS